MPDIQTQFSAPFHYIRMGSGPALVLLHGFPENSTLWRNIWSGLGEHFTLLIPDLPGCGSSVATGDVSMETMAQCIKELLDHEGIAKAVIAGHSMGGYLAFAIADLYPEYVHGLSIIHSMPCADDDEKKSNRLKASEVIRKGAKEAFVRQMVPNLFDPGFANDHPDVVSGLIDSSLNISAAAMIAFYKAMIERPDREHVLAPAAYPVQWIIGKQDGIMPYDKILQHCYKANINFVSLYDHCGHMSMLETPAKLQEDLLHYTKYCYQLS